jgi:MFS transporter, OFA family, oxalate/formate antiporter
MPEKKIMNRNFAVFGAIIIQFCLGAIYAWSVFTPSLTDNGWSKTQTQAVFSAGLALFAIVMVLAGRMMPKLGPKKLAMSGGVVLGLGYLLAGLLGGTNFWLIFFFIGIIGGSGIGLAYVVPIAVGMRWFPDKKGLITGLAVAGFGFGATLWVKLAGNWGNLIETHGLSNTFTIYGIIFFIAVLLGSVWMVFPPEGWKPKGWIPSESQKKADHSDKQFNSGEMLRTPQFYMILLTFVFAASAGLMVIGNIVLFAKDELAKAGIDDAAAVAIAGTAMAVFYAIANGLGRIIWGSISDKIGRKKSIMLNVISQGVLVIVFQWIAGVEGLLYLGAALIGFNFGGCFSLFPSITADTFGTRYIGQNYGWVFLAYGFGGIMGPILAGKLGDLKNFPLAFTISGILCLIAAIIIFQVKPPKLKSA